MKFNSDGVGSCIWIAEIGQSGSAQLWPTFEAPAGIAANRTFHRSRRARELINRLNCAADADATRHQRCGVAAAATPTITKGNSQWNSVCSRVQLQVVLQRTGMSLRKVNYSMHLCQCIWMTSVISISHSENNRRTQCTSAKCIPQR